MHFSGTDQNMGENQDMTTTKDNGMGADTSTEFPPTTTSGPTVTTSGPDLGAGDGLGFADAFHNTTERTSLSGLEQLTQATFYEISSEAPHLAHVESKVCRNVNM